MSHRERIKTASDAILASDDWDKKIALAHLLGELSGIGLLCDHRQFTVEQLSEAIAGACERTVRMLAIGRQVEADE